MTAKEKLKEITKRPRWYGDVFKTSTAHHYKLSLKKNKLDNYQCAIILRKLGYKPKLEEVW